jgi:N-methylhydantoinase B
MSVDPAGLGGAEAGLQKRAKGQAPERAALPDSPGQSVLAPLEVPVFQHLFAAVAEEMGARLVRSAFSANIVERRDFSCALFDSQGRMIAQAAHLPVHLGAAPRSVAAVLARASREPEFALVPGDAVLLNDPFEGGSHLPDLTLVSPVFLRPGAAPGTPPDAFVCNRAHHADVGGPFPGSMGPAREIHGEGLRLPPIKLVRAGRLDREVLSIFLANVRVPAEREGDLLAQWASNRLGQERLDELAVRFGADVLASRAADQIAWTAALTRELLSAWPRGSVTVVDELELPAGESARLELCLTHDERGLVADFRGSSPAINRPLNTPRAVVESAVFYALRLLLPPGTPTNAGVLAPATILTTPGSLLDARYPAAVAAGNTETSQRLVDLLLRALGDLAPGRLPACSAGTMSNLSFGQRAFTHYETIGGGAGGGPGGPGLHARHTHMTNTRNTPLEALERAYPVRVQGATVRRGSGGDGRHRGGDGIVKHLRFFEPVEVGWLGGRQRRGPPGQAGGEPGAPGGMWVRSEGEAPWQRLEPVDRAELPAGGELRVETPGGGGFGTPVSGCPEPPGS